MRRYLVIDIETGVSQLYSSLDQVAHAIGVSVQEIEYDLEEKGVCETDRLTIVDYLVSPQSVCDDHGCKAP